MKTYLALFLLALTGVTHSTLFAAPANDAFAARAALGGTSAAGSNVGATRESGEPVNVQYGAERSALGANSVWWSWTPATSGSFTISTAGSSFDTQLGIYTGSAFPLTEVASNEDADGAQAALTASFVAGTSYSILVAGFEGQSGTIQLNISGGGGGGGGGSRFNLTTQANPLPGGTVTVVPSADADGKYAAGTVVTVRAIPNAGFNFASWSGDASGSSNPLEVTLNSDKSVIANFQSSVAQRFPLQVNIAPVAGGSVVATPAPGPDGLYEPGQSVTITATPSAGFTFVSWSGDASGTASSTQVVLGGPRVVTANFAPQSGGGERVQLNVSRSPAAGGTVEVSPAPETDGKYARGATVTLTATPASGFTFRNWSGGATGSANPLSLQLNTDTAVTAHFESAAPSNDCTRVVILTPRAGTRTRDESVVVRGLAGPADQVVAVQVSVNDGPFQAATGVSPWEATVPLQIGENRISVKAIGPNGCESKLAARVVVREDRPRFEGSRGEYNGLIFDESAPSCESSGFFRLCVTDRGTVSARFEIDGVEYRGAGAFDAEGNAAFDLRRNQIVLHVRLHLPPDTAVGEISGTVEKEGSWTAELKGDRRYYSWSRNRSAPQAGKYDVKFNDGARGGAKVVIDKAGNFFVKGELDNKTKFESSGFISQAGDMPVYDSIRCKQSCVVGWLHFPAGGTTPIDGTLIWLRHDRAPEEIAVTPGRVKQHEDHGKKGKKDEKGKGKDKGKGGEKGKDKGNDHHEDDDDEDDD